MEAKLKLIKWMVGFNIALTLASLVVVLIWV
jgi:hypothetical protein